MKMNVAAGHSKESVISSGSEVEETTDSTAESSSSSEELKPLSSLIKNRKKMVEVAFSAVGEEIIKEMVPSFLKDASLDELKLMCYEELCSLTDEAVKAILEGNNWNEALCTEEQKNISSVDICDHEPRTACGFEACKSEDTTTSSDSKNKDILEIGISEEEMNRLLKEISNAQDISKDSLAMSSPSHSVLSTSGKQHSVSDGGSAVHGDSLHVTEVKPDALNEDMLELLELEHRARSIRSLILQCDTEEENVFEISGKSSKIDSSESTNVKKNKRHDVTESQKHQELDPLFFVSSPASTHVLRSPKKKRRHSSSKNKHDTFGHTEAHMSCDYTVTESKIAESKITKVEATCKNLKAVVNQTVGYDSHHTGTLESPRNNSIARVFRNRGHQLHITVNALNGLQAKKELQMSSCLAEKLREKNIHKVVETSKMCTRLRERLKRTQQLKKFKEVTVKTNTVILGTVEEYKSLNTK